MYVYLTDTVTQHGSQPPKVNIQLTKNLMHGNQTYINSTTYNTALLKSNSRFCLLIYPVFITIAIVSIVVPRNRLSLNEGNVARRFINASLLTWEIIWIIFWNITLKTFLFFLLNYYLILFNIYFNYIQNVTTL